MNISPKTDCPHIDETRLMVLSEFEKINSIS